MIFKNFSSVASQRKRQQYFFYTLLLGIFLLIGLLAMYYNRSFDLTSYQGNSLNKTSIQITERLDAPLSMTAFVSQQGKSKKLIKRLIEKYQDHANIELTFKNPNTAMDLVREHNITHEGQLLLQYKGQSSLVSDLSETSITRGIYGVQQRQVRQIVFVTGHDEIYPKNNNAFSQLREHLTGNQLDLLAANLSLTKKVPDNTDLLVLAAPQTPYSNDETQWIINYINQGGQLLWLADSKSIEIPKLSRTLAAKIQPTTILNQSGKPYQFNKSRYLAIRPHSDFMPLQRIQEMLAMPNSSPVKTFNTEEASKWQALPFLQIIDKSYLQQDKNISQLKESPFIGLQLTSKDLNHQQRAVLLGSIDFLRNEWIGQGENTTFAVQLFKYLSTPSNQFIQIENTQPDAVIISTLTLAWLGIIFIILLPIVILIIGKIIIIKSQKVWGK